MSLGFAAVNTLSYYVEGSTESYSVLRQRDHAQDSQARIPKLVGRETPMDVVSAATTLLGQGRVSKSCQDCSSRHKSHELLPKMQSAQSQHQSLRQLLSTCKVSAESEARPLTDARYRGRHDICACSSSRTPKILSRKIEELTAYLQTHMTSHSDTKFHPQDLSNGRCSQATTVSSMHGLSCLDLCPTLAVCAQGGQCQ